MQYEKSVRCYQKTSELYKELHGDKPRPDVASSLNNMDVAYQAQGNADEVLEYFEQALEMRKEIYGDYVHRDLAISLNNVGRSCQVPDEVSKALECFEQELKMSLANDDVTRIACQDIGVCITQQHWRSVKKRSGSCISARRLLPLNKQPPYKSRCIRRIRKLLSRNRFSVSSLQYLIKVIASGDGENELWFGGEKYDIPSIAEENKTE